MSRLLNVVAVMVVLSVTASCMSMRTPMTDFATDYNRVIADTRNEMILLNIVRARFREPTHYSTLSQVGGSIGVAGSASAGLSGIIDDIDASAGTGLSVRSSPSFTIVPLNTQQFAGGILRPIEPNVVAIFLSQGWDPNTLAILLIESIDCGNGEEYLNDLRDDDVRREGNYLTRQQIFGLGFTMGSAGEESEEPLMTLSASESGTMENILENLGDDYRVTIGLDDDGQARFEVREKLPQILSVTTPSDVCGGQELSPSNYELRSAEGVIYFLGEALRIPGGLRNAENRTIFNVTNNPPSGGHSVHVDHRGDDWFLAAAEGPGSDRSIQVISLVSQLIALQTSSEALERSPSTLTVN